MILAFILLSHNPHLQGIFIMRVSTLIVNLVIFFLLCSFFVLMPSSALGKVYTWKDKNGIKQFSNIAPPRSDKKLQWFDETTTDKDKSQLSNPLPDRFKKNNHFKVLKVFDGDTIKVKGHNNLVIVVRFAGIDAPETRKRDAPGQPYGEKAKQMVENMISGKTIFLKTYGTGGYNRVLAEIFTERGVNINFELVRQGLAEVYRGRVPDGFDTAPYFRAEAAAKRSRRGIWSLGFQYKSPRQWRRKHPWKR